MEEQNQIEAKPNFNPEQIELIKSNILNFSIFDSIENPYSLNQIDRYDFKMGTHSSMNKDYIIRVVIEVDILVLFNNQDKSIPVGRIATDFFFKIVDIEKYFVKKEVNKIDLPSIIGATLIGIAYSTTRGILLSKSAGTILSNAILPILSPASLLKI